ncbi:MAG: hypothetical protein IJU19_08245 [Bacteroidales bacterium]|nr:hypothetical protein [Bacteroidales bacterium]
MIRGGLYAVGITTGVFLIAVAVEHWGWLPQWGRGLLFWGGIMLTVAAAGWLVVRPWMKMRGIGRRISHSEAALIIGKHFPEVSDRLLNLLQLMGEDESKAGDESLLAAAIAQKTAQLRPVPMLSAIDLGANRRYLKYALPPLGVITLLLIVAPRWITDPSRRIVHYTEYYERPAPFRFVVENEHLEVQRGEDIEIRVGVAEARAIPSEVYLCEGGRRHRMSALGKEDFSYQFKQVNSDMRFVIEGGGVVSKSYLITVRPNPSVIDYVMTLTYPTYTGYAAETLTGIGDAAVPEGTLARWIFHLQDADSLVFMIGESRQVLPCENGQAEVSLRAMQSTDYAFCAYNQFRTSDTLHYRLTAIADAAPMIAVEEVVDSAYPDRRMFFGHIKDDYGFSRLAFVHHVENHTPSEVELALGEGVAQEFSFSFNLAELPLAPGERITYYFEVRDNDALHGPKATRSRIFEYAEPTAEEIDSIISRGESGIKQSMESQMEAVRQLQQEIADMQRRLLDKKELGWQEKKDLEQLAQKQRQMQQMMQQIRQQIQENNRLEQKYREQSEQLLEKQREIERLMNEVMDEKMQETIAEIERMLSEMDKNKVQEGLDQLKISNKELEQQLDQNLELLKHLELEKQVEQAVEKANQLAAEQRDVSRETQEHKGKSNEELQEKQQQLNDRFQQLKEDISQIEQKQQSLDPSNPFKSPNEIERQVEQHQQQATHQMQQGNNKDASQQQQQAADGLEQLAEELNNVLEEMEQEELAEDAEQVRRLLKNIVQLSINQEELIGEVNKVYIQDPRYQSIIARQNRVKDDFRGVEDSLRAVARRQVQIASVVARELAEVNSAIGRSLGSLLYMNQGFYNGYTNRSAASPMQYSMTSLNNLALMLAESLDQMQNQMRQNAQRQKGGKQRMKGNNKQQCNNPGNRPSPQSMRQMQQELNRQMEALKKQLDRQGKQPSGRHQVGQGQTMSEEFARMAAQQEMIRRMMQQYGQELKEGNAGNGQLAREIDQLLRQMEQTEADLVNRTITQQTLHRQQQIMTRLLEHEKADMEREKDDRRESHEANSLYAQPSPAELEKYRKQTHPNAESLPSAPPSFTPYYRQKVNDYFYHQ